MSKPIIEHFDFGKSSGVSQSQREKASCLPPDNLILVDAFWVKDGMKIRFIPHQMIVDLIVVFKLKYDDGTRDRHKAKYHLKFDIPETWYKNGNKEIVIEYSKIEGNLFSAIGLKKMYSKEDGHECYYYIIKDFSSDLTKVIF